MSSPKAPSAPAPTAAELEAQRSQTGLLNDLRRMLEAQGEESRLLQPLLFSELGLEPTYQQQAPRISGIELRPLLPPALKSNVDINAMYTLEDALGMTGENESLQEKVRKRFEGVQSTLQLTGITKRPATAEEQKRTQIEGLSLDRELAALRGELPVNPGLLSDLDYQQRQLENTLAKQLGPGWQISTPGVEAVKSFNTMKNTVLENARRGDLTLADALQTAAMANRQAAQGQLFGLSGATTQLPFGNISGFGQAAGGYGQLAQQLAQQRLAQYGQQLQAYGMGSGGGIGSAFGSLAGILGGSMFGGAGSALGGQLGGWLGGMFK